MSIATSAIASSIAPMSLVRPARDQIVGRQLVDLVGEAAYARAKPYIDRALAGETVTYEGELAYERAGFRHIEAQFTPDIAPTARWWAIT
jgi:hypothetical protein